MASSDAATIARVCQHMNNDHADALCDYARYYARLPTSLAKTARLTTLSTTKLTLTITSSHGGTSEVNIPLSPPMESLLESRERLVAMAHEAAEGLGRSRYKVTRFVLPDPVGVAVVAAVGFGYWSFWNASAVFARGGFVKEKIFLGGLDSVSALLEKYGGMLFWGVLAIHAVECVWIHRSRLRKHGVPTASSLWWKWILMTFFEGVGSVRRFEREVRRLEEEAASRKDH
ncbi:hypothetical protein FN846DRAFT_456020 [Sphaerosporella brunnea]|uniref:DUF2470 domain-containing protein n=1 Tax=Sphaerosporella brunnea TaxID=1250544 RepID=A0A5J5EG45_9PEZI|nr:hypothetical protein FN846DRAFT_456020 [Sphaerosporella brunnea]